MLDKNFGMRYFVKVKLMKIYLSSPFFNPTEIKNMRAAQNILQQKGHQLFVPMDLQVQKTEDEIDWAKQIFKLDKVGIDK